VARRAAGGGSAAGRRALDEEDTRPLAAAQPAAPAPSTAEPAHVSETDIADQDTAPLTARVRRTYARASQRMPRVWLVRLALVAGLVVLGLRASDASLALMSPGGDIVGWSVLPTVTHPLDIAPPPPQSIAKHQNLTPAEYAAFLTQHLTLDDKLGQMIMIQFYDSAMTPDLTQMISQQRVGGVLLLGRPVQAGDRDLNAQMQKVAGIPLLVAIDQEGGSVNRFFDVAGPLPGAGSLTTPAAANAQGQADAAMLHQYGYNLNLAPVVDVGVPNPIDQFVGRTFSQDPAQVATLAGAYVDGLQASGQVTSVLKHFPGGVEATYMDPHVVMPMLNRSRAEWESTDLAPYRALLANNDVRAIMVSHEMIPTVDPTFPTSLSPAVIDGTLRGELHFNGVVMTDDLHMKALETQWTIAEASVLAVEAGVDIVADMASADEVQSVTSALKQAISSGKLSQARIDASVTRILTFKIEMGLIPMPPQSSAGQRTGPQDSVPIDAALPSPNPSATPRRGK
jgi:beta-N-acetylhexosaminidase